MLRRSRVEESWHGSCAQHRLHRAATWLAHVASGVAGLQLAISAGLGVACLNESALAPGIARLHAPGLPALPAVEFRLLPARAGESEFMGLAREAIIKTMS